MCTSFVLRSLIIVLSAIVPDHTCHRSKGWCVGSIHTIPTGPRKRTECNPGACFHSYTQDNRPHLLRIPSPDPLFTGTSAVLLSFSIPIISYSFATLAPLPGLALICCSTCALQIGSLHAIVLSKNEPDMLTNWETIFLALSPWLCVLFLIIWCIHLNFGDSREFMRINWTIVKVIYILVILYYYLEKKSITLL